MSGVRDSIVDLRARLAGEPIKDPDEIRREEALEESDRSEYFDRLGVPEPVVEETPTTQPPRGRDRYGNPIHDRMRTEFLDSRRGYVNSYSETAVTSASIEPPLNDSPYYRNTITAPTYMQFRTYSGDREVMSQKMLSEDHGSLMDETSNITGLNDIMKSSIDVHLREIIQEAQRLVYNLCTENSENLRRGSSGDSKRMVHGAIELMLHGYFLRMQEFVNFGYQHRISFQPERFSEVLFMRVFTSMSGVEREAVVNFPLETF